jgi:hypothetical protein
MKGPGEAEMDSIEAVMARKGIFLAKIKFREKFANFP